MERGDEEAILEARGSDSGTSNAICFAGLGVCVGSKVHSTAASRRPNWALAASRKRARKRDETLGTSQGG